MLSLLERGNWTLITSGPPYKLHEAWWGKTITTRTIPISDDIDVNDVSTQPPVGVSPQSIVDGWHTIVNIDQGVTTRPLGEMLLRREFVTTLEVVKSHASGFPDSGVVVSGQPGIGKTVCLWYLLRCRLSERLPTIFAIGDTFIFFHKTGAYFPSPIGPPGLLSYDAAAASDVLVWALIDRMTNNTGPPSWLLSTEVFPVQTSSPNLLQYKSWSEERVAYVYTMNAWDWDELVAGLPFQMGVNVKGIDYSRLQEAYHKYGPVPRNVYSAYRGLAGLRDYDHLTSDVIADASQSFDRLQSLVWGSARYNSPFVAQELLRAPAFANLRDKRKVVRLFTALPEMGVARRWIFQIYGHEYLSTSNNNPEGIITYTLTPVSTDPQKYMPNPDSHHAGAPFPLITRKLHVYESPDDIRGRHSSEPEYYIPLVRNNPGFDSFLITETAVYIFQMTVSHEHAVDTRNQRGLGLLKKMLPQNIPWHYVMVMPRANIESVRLTLVHQEWIRAVASFQLIALDVRDVSDQ